MKKTNEKNNKGFSLVELIVVIAIMIVLVAVLAPVFTKYVEQSRRATDVTNANTIAEAVLVEAADSNLPTNTTPVAVDTSVITSVKEVPEVKGDAVSGEATFYYKYDKASNTVEVYIGNDTDTDASGNLADETKAQTYKEADSGSLGN